ncbi:hypothetical protein [Oscillatoria sp. FACHB-1406]|uniref:hypothetical protein n=1 Tax=Oscillatoria sp. FACHB-1406 TaxID=2692846 RepID=UPI001687B9D1|nr:hypothetical protein [Oscillatoria sp. FACHB-1406]MBD2577559.1 hypothetical protein [Oscillatoria sp. FACHB-1406]
MKFIPPAFDLLGRGGEGGLGDGGTGGLGDGGTGGRGDGETGGWGDGVTGGRGDGGDRVLSRDAMVGVAELLPF